VPSAAEAEEAATMRESTTTMKERKKRDIIVNYERQGRSKVSHTSEE